MPVEYPAELKPELFPASPLAVALSSGPPSAPPHTGVGACPKKLWGIRELTLSCAGKTSISHSDPDHAPLPGGRGGRFFFAPIEEAVTIRWKLKNPAEATTLTFELFRAGSSAPVWSHVLNADDARVGEFVDWTGTINGGVVNAGHSPYKLRATAGAGREDGFAERFTYFDVLIHEVKLEWGGKTLLPGGAPTGVVGACAVATRQAEEALNDALVARTRNDDTLDPADRYELKLPCNRFNTDARSMDETGATAPSSLFQSHREQWGDGPRFPLIGKVYIAKAAGGGVHGGEAAKAIGDAEFLWDWESEDAIAGLGGRGLHGSVRAFLTQSLDYRRNDPDGPPGSTNCHADRGGKRGGTTRVFTPLAGYGTNAVLGTTRKWSMFTTASLAGPNAGCTGVVFSPSRMALDTYSVSLVATPDVAGGGRAALDTTDTAIQQRVAHPSLPIATSGTFEVLREVRMRYVPKSAAVVPADLQAIAAEYRKAGIVMDFGSAPDRTADMAALGAHYQQWFTNAIEHPDAHGNNVVTQFGRYFERDDQLQAGTGADTTFAFVAQSYETFTQNLLIDAIREYVLEKPRVKNTPRKRYQRWIDGGGTRATDDRFLLPFYNGLSESKRAKVDRLYEAKLEASGILDRPFYQGMLTDTAVHMWRMIGSELLRHIGVPGMVILHVEDTVGYRLPPPRQGMIVVPYATTGGLSPSAAAQPSGGTGALHLVFLPENARRAHPKYPIPVTPVITHESGHNLFLGHAPARRTPVEGRPTPDNAPGNQPLLHDAADLLCLMNYDRDSNHLCGFCHLKLMGWATAKKQGQNVVGLAQGLEPIHNTAAQNVRQP